MNDKVKIALIAALAALGVAWMIMHYSPYQTCVRAKAARIADDVAEVRERYKPAEPVSNQVVPGFEDVPSVTPSVEETAAEAKRTAEIMCAGGQP
jgi:hypothetical protein